MKGRARLILEDFQRAFPGVDGTFKMSRVILHSKILPEEVTRECDDENLEDRLENSILIVTGYIVKV